MAFMQHKTRGNTSPVDKPKVYISDCGAKTSQWTDILTADLLEAGDCAVCYYNWEETVAVDENYKNDLSGMQLIVIPVTEALFCENNRALEVDYPYAMEHNIAVLPIILEPGLLKRYTAIFGPLQFLDRQERDNTARSYQMKLTAFLQTFMFAQEQIKNIRNNFDAYIFLSYRKKDRFYANELMRWIHNVENFSNIAIWYDEYLTPGESFSDSIKTALEKAPVFALAVTPNLLEPDNYVMKHEYPEAKKQEKIILPMELQQTNREQLEASYQGIPAVIDPQDAAEWGSVLSRSFHNQPAAEKKNTPEHFYLKGLAYLYGIDVEVDNNRGARYIEKAAMGDHLEAIEKLIDMYDHGIGVELSGVKALVWRCRLNYLLKKEMAQDSSLLPRYIQNLQRAAEWESNQYHIRISRWIEAELEWFIRTYETKKKDPAIQKMVCDCLLIVRHLSAEEAVRQIKRIVKDESKQKLLLINAHLRVKNFGTYSRKEKAHLKKGIALCRKSLKTTDSAEIKLCLAQALFLLACRHRHTTSKRWRKKESRLYQEAFSLCEELTDNARNLPAGRCMAQICCRSIYGLGKAAALKAGEQMERILAYTSLEEDQRLLGEVYHVLSYLCEGEEAKRYKGLAEALAAAGTASPGYSEAQRDVLKCVLSLAQVAREQSFHNAQDWDAFVMNYLTGENIKVYDMDLLPEAAQVLACDLRNALANAQRCRFDAKDIWHKCGMPDVAAVCVEKLLRTEAVSAKTAQECYGACEEALGILCEAFGFVWRWHTWQGIKPTDFMPKEKAEAVVARAREIQSGTEKLSTTNQDYFVALMCVDALQYLAEGDIIRAKQVCELLEKEIDFGRLVVSNAPTWVIYELLALLCDGQPDRKQAYLRKANEQLEKNNSEVCRLCLAMNFYDLSQLALAREDTAAARKLLEKALAIDVCPTRYSVYVLHKICTAYGRLLKKIAPKTAQKEWNRYFYLLQRYLQRNEDPELLRKFVLETLAEKTPDNEEGQLIVALLAAGVEKADRRGVANVLYKWLREEKTWRMTEKKTILTFCEQCLAEEDTLENRRLYASAVVKVGVLLREALMEEDHGYAAVTARLEKAKTLLEEVEAQWKEEDGVLFRDIEVLQSRYSAVALDAGQKEILKKQHQDDHLEETLQTKLSVITEEFYSDAEKEATLTEIEAALEKGISLSLCVRIYTGIDCCVNSGRVKVTKKLRRRCEETLEKLAAQTLSQAKKLSGTPKLREALSDCRDILRHTGHTEEVSRLLEAEYRRSTISTDAADAALLAKEYGYTYIGLGVYARAALLLEKYVVYLKKSGDRMFAPACEDIVQAFLRYDSFAEAGRFFKMVFDEYLSQAQQGELKTKLTAEGCLQHLVMSVVSNCRNIKQKQLLACFGKQLQAYEDHLLETNMIGEIEHLLMDYSYSGLYGLANRGVALAKRLAKKSWDRRRILKNARKDRNKLLLSCIRRKR